MTYEEGQLVGLENEPNKAGIFIGNEVDGCQQVDFLWEDGEFHREYVKKDKICTLEWNDLNEQARQKIRKRVSILNMGYESGSWNFMYLIDGKRGNLFQRKLELAKEILCLFGMEEKDAEELKETLFYLANECEHNEERELEAWFCYEYPEFGKYSDLMLFLIPIFQALVSQGFFNIDMVDIANLLHSAGESKFSNYHTYWFEKEDFEDTALIAKHLKSDANMQTDQVKGVFVCLRGKKLMFYQVQDLMNTIKRTFKEAEIVLGVSETLVDMKTRMSVSFV